MSPSIDPQQSILFLDLDGVVNAHGFDSLAQSNLIDRDKIALVNSILVHSSAKIVLSSAWRYLIYRGDMNMDGLDWLLRSHGLMANSVVGITHEDTVLERDDMGNITKVMENERTLQIARFRNKIGHRGKYVILDDMDLGFTKAKQPFIQTIGSQGITREDVNKVNAIFSGGYKVNEFVLIDSSYGMITAVIVKDIDTSGCYHVSPLEEHIPRCEWRIPAYSIIRKATK